MRDRDDRVVVERHVDARRHRLEASMSRPSRSRRGWRGRARAAPSAGSRSLLAPKAGVHSRNRTRGSETVPIFSWHAEELDQVVLALAEGGRPCSRPSAGSRYSRRRSPGTGTPGHALLRALLRLELEQVPGRRVRRPAAGHLVRRVADEHLRQRRLARAVRPHDRVPCAPRLRVHPLEDRLLRHRPVFLHVEDRVARRHLHTCARRARRPPLQRQAASAAPGRWPQKHRRARRP